MSDLTAKATARPRRLRLAAATAIAAVSATVLAGAGGSGATAAPPGSPMFGPVIDYAASYDGQSTCSPTVKPGLAAFRSMVQSAYGVKDMGIVRACSIGGTSEHKEGRAWDIGFNYYNSTQRAQADQLIAWLLATDEHGNEYANARRLGVMYIIWNRRIFRMYRPHDGWLAYTGPDPHTSHIHMSFSWDGALKRSTWYSPQLTFIDNYQQAGSEDGVMRPIAGARPLDIVEHPDHPNVDKVYVEELGSVTASERFSR